MTDITALILDDHEWFRRRFAALDDARSKADLHAVWRPLARRLETHASAEESVFYPRLLERSDEDAEETKDALRDHNKIRDAIAEADRHEVGSDAWYEHVGRARTENSQHLTEEEDGALPDFRKHADLALREELAGQWLRFHADHPAGDGIASANVAIGSYLKDHKP